MNSSFRKKIISGALVGVLLFPSLFLTVPSVSSAQGLGGIASSVAACAGFSVGGIISGLGSSLSSLLGGKKKSSSNAVPTLDKKNLKEAQNISNKESCLDKIGTAVAKMLLAKMTNDIIDWINSGFKGDPFFISNPEAFFRDVANETTGIFIEAAGATELCNSFRPDVVITIATDPVRKLYEHQSRCTLEDIVDNARDFYDNFNNGGWKGWVSVNVEQQNNPFGAYWMGQRELTKRIDEEKTVREQEIAQGSGYQSAKHCIKYDPKYIQDKNTYAGSAYAGGIPGCEDYEVATPGALIASQANVIAQTPIKQAEQIDEFDEAMDAIFDALTSQLLKQGLNQLSGSGVRVTGGGGTPNWYGQYANVQQQNEEIIDTVATSTVLVEKYLEVTKTYVGALSYVGTSWEKARSCWAKLSNAVAISDYIDPWNRAEELVTALNEEEGTYQEQIDKTPSILEKLGEIGDQLTGALDLNQQNALYQQYASLLAELPRQEDIDSVVDLTNSLVNESYLEAVDSYKACKSECNNPKHISSVGQAMALSAACANI